MRTSGLLLFFYAVVSLAAAAQSPAPSPAKPAADPFASQPLVIELSQTTYRMHADGTGERDEHVILRIQSDAAARQFSVLSTPYAAASETPHIIFVRVHKPSGATVETPASDAIDMPAEVSREAPLYSDLKEKHIPVRSLSAGDKLEYEVDTTIDKAESSSNFWGSQHFVAPGTVVVLSEVLHLEVPKDKYVQVWSPNHKPDITDSGNLRTYAWTVPQLVPPPTKDASGDTPDLPRDPDTDDDGRALPSVAWTTFHSWAELGDWYRSLSAARLEPTDAIRARADELTKGLTSPEDQLRAIYTFVSTSTRYIGIDFGVGRYQPHSAAEVLANQYGDCKDKDTLLESLLRAKGFPTAPALIGAGIALVPDVPSPALFNHVITTVNLPSGRIWLDSTPEVSPFRFLLSSIRDQQALVVPPSGPATLQRTPTAPPYTLADHFESDGTVDAEGKFTAHITSSYRSDNEVIVRSLARTVAPSQIDKLSQYLASTTGFGGSTSNTSISSPTSLADPIQLKYDYTRSPYGDWNDLRITPAMPVVELVTPNTSKAPKDDYDLGPPRTLVAISRITLPDGWRTDLPDPVHVKTPFATFDKTYRFDGKQIVAERDITVLQSKIPKAGWQRYVDFYKQTDFDNEPWIQLIRSVPSHPIVSSSASTAVKNDKDAKKPGSKDVIVTLSGETTTPPAGGLLPADATIPQLFQQAYQQLRAMNTAGARATLDQIKTKNPNEPYLWGLYGSVAATEHNYDEAETDLRKELSTRPDDARMVLLLASIQQQQKEVPKARATLQKFFDAHQDNTDIGMMLAALQTQADDNAGAVKTLEALSSKVPDDHNVTLRLAYALLKVGRQDEAMAAAKSAMDSSDDPNLLNDGSYLLSKSGLDLAYAESASRKSIDLLETKSAAISTEEVNSKAFANASLLMASWDTLGWILFRENKFDEALQWVLPAWRNYLSSEGADHVGQIYEALNKPADALTYYQFAKTGDDKNTDSDVRAHFTSAIARLTAAGAKPAHPADSQALQDTRTYKLTAPAGISGWGTFRLQVATSGVIAAEQVGGDQKKLAPILPVIKAMKFPDLLPPQSKAHLLRDGVLSCSAKSTCELVLVPNSSLRTESQ